jgi:hypothetical protein
MEYALVRSRPTAEGARWSFTSGNLARGTAPAKDVHLRASVMQASVLPSDTSASRIFAMGCNKRGFRPERLELSLSLPPSSRPACGVLTIDTSGAAQVRILLYVEHWAVLHSSLSGHQFGRESIRLARNRSRPSAQVTDAQAEARGLRVEPCAVALEVQSPAAPRCPAVNGGPCESVIPSLMLS